MGCSEMVLSKDLKEEKDEIFWGRALQKKGPVREKLVRSMPGVFGVRSGRPERWQMPRLCGLVGHWKGFG